MVAVEPELVEDDAVAVVSYTLFAVVEGVVVEGVLAVGTQLDAVEAGDVLVHVVPVVVGVDVAVLPAELGRLGDP